jgi:hypothetical protein
MYHPLFIFDGQTGQLIAAVLRPGTCPASRGALAVLRRLVPTLRARWPGVHIEVRADAGFAVPALYAYLEAAGLDYTIGLATNRRLATLAAPLAAQAAAQRRQTGEKARLFTETAYQAGSWDHPRRVIIKAEALAKGMNVRFVVTSRTDEPATLYHWYTQRGDRPELCIKDLKDGCFADRLSDHRFWPNQFRLLLHAAAYWLLDTIRRWLTQRQVPHLQLGTLRLQLIKIGGWIRRRVGGLALHLARSHPGEPLWYLLATRPGRLRE